MATAFDAYYPFTGINVAQADWERMAILYRADGVVPDMAFPSFTNNKLAVSQRGAGANMSVDVAAGRMVIQGGFGENSGVKNLVVDAADATNQRTDRITAAVVFGTPIMQLAVKKGANGTPTSSSPPALTQNGTTWELSLAQVIVNPGVTTIVNGNITDERSNPNVCGYSYSDYPSAICTSTTRPASFPQGGFIFQTDNSQLYCNLGTYAAPSWSQITTPGAVTKVFRTVHTWAIPGPIAVPSGETNYIVPFYVSLAAGETINVVAARYSIHAGTSVTAKLTKNGSDMAGYSGGSAMNITTTPATTTATVALADADALALVVTGVSGSPQNMAVTVILEHTV